MKTNKAFQRNWPALDEGLHKGSARTRHLYPRTCPLTSLSTSTGLGIDRSSLRTNARRGPSARRWELWLRVVAAGGSGGASVVFFNSCCPPLRGNLHRFYCHPYLCLCDLITGSGCRVGSKPCNRVTGLPHSWRSMQVSSVNLAPKSTPPTAPPGSAGAV